MKVCLIGDGWFPDRPGGLNRYVRSLFEALSASGLKVEPEAIVLGPADDAPVAVHVACSASAPFVSRIVTTARSCPWDLDVVDAHFAPYALWPVLSARRRGHGVVAHFHGPWAEESIAAGTSSRLAVWVKTQIERAVLRRADELVTLSGAFRRHLMELHGIVPWRIRVIPPAIDLDLFSPGDRFEARRALQIPDELWVAASVRRLVPRMGLELLLDAWALAQPDGGILLIAGEGPERVALERRAAEIEPRGSVRIVGRLEDRDLVELYRAADVTVVPSRSLEGFGLVVAESLACGTPVIVTDAGGLPEAVLPLDASLVVPASSVEALAQRLRRAREGKLPDRERCRRYATRFDSGRLVKEHVEVYRRAMERPTQIRARIVFLDHTAAMSGAEIALLRVLPTLTEHVDPHVILAEGGPVVSELQAAGISVEVLPMHEGARSARRDSLLLLHGAPGAATYALRLARRLRRIDPDLVHTNSLKAALYGAAAARLAHVPVVWHVHDRIEEDYLPPVVVRGFRVAARTLPAAIIANSRATLETLPGVRNGSVVANALPPTMRAIRDPGRDRVFRVGMVGRIAPWKGQHIFLEAFARAFPSDDSEAVLVGAPLFGHEEEEYLEHVLALAKQLGLDGRLVYTGFSRNVAAELATFDVLVHASLKPEPFGQVILEGMAAGLPVVVAAAGGPLEFVSDSVDGLLYPTGDVKALSDALRRLSADPGLRRRLSDGGLAKAREYSPDAIARRIEAVYEDVLARAGRKLSTGSPPPNNYP